MRFIKKFVLDEYEYIFNLIKIADTYMLNEFSEDYVKNEVLGSRDNYEIIELYYFVENDELIEFIIDVKTGRTITEEDIPNTVIGQYYRCHEEAIKKYKETDQLFKV